MFKKDATLITVVNNEEIHFIDSGRNSEWQLLQSLSLDQFLSDSADTDLIPEEIRQKTNSVLVVPDYWIGNVSHIFQSKKRALAEAFVERKLQADHGDLPDIKYFFDFHFEKTHEDEQSLYVYFLQEPRAFQLYDQLTESGLRPLLITSPAFIWEKKLRQAAADFHEGGKGLMHLLPMECFLYFFYQGRYLFSRNIAIPSFQEESSEISNILSYEINQSIYLFSQKVKAEIDQFYLVSSNGEKIQGLSETLGKDIKDLGAMGQRPQTTPEIVQSLGPMDFFSADDLSLSREFLSISHKQLKAELQWKPVQTMGIVVGLFLICLLGAETLFLWNRSSDHTPGIRNGTMTDMAQKQIIQKYNDALGLILAETARPSPGKVITNIARSLPDNVQIEEMVIEMETNPGVDLHCAVKAIGPDQFRESLSAFIDNLNEHIKGPRQVNINEIDFKLDKGSIGQEYQKYQIAFRVDLP